jgi:hypothetical protein
MDNNNNNNNDKKKQDDEAKAQARAEARAARPGAVSVSKDQAASLDQRIAEKQRNGSVTSPPGAPKSPPASSLNTPSSNTDKRLEQEVQAKQRAKGARESQPGAVQVAAVSVSARAELESLEGDVAAKSRGAAPPRDSAQVALTSLEDRISAKLQQNDAKRPPAAPDAANTPEARAALDSLEDRIAAKTRRDGGGGTAKSVARAELQGLEDSVAAKQNSYAGSGGEDALSRLDDRIAAKNAAYDRDNGDRKMAPAAAATMAGATMVGAGAAGKKGDAPMEAAYSAHADNGFDKKSSIDDLPEKAPEKGIQDGGVAGADGYDAGYGHGGSLLDNEDFEYGVHDDIENTEGLAIAMPVEEDDENVFIPSAVEYDPDAKPPMYRNRRFRLYAFLAFFVLVVAAVGAGVGIAVGKDDDQGISRQVYRESLGIKELLERVVGADILEDTTSPYHKALRWVTYQDPMELTPDNPTFLQRYFAAYFYLATSMTRGWESCNPPDLDAGEDASCIYLKLITVNPDIKRLPTPGSFRWLSEVSECKWIGVICDEFDQLRSIDLSKWTLGSLRMLFSVMSNI